MKQSQQQLEKQLLEIQDMYSNGMHVVSGNPMPRMEMLQMQINYENQVGQHTQEPLSIAQFAMGDKYIEGNL